MLTAEARTLTGRQHLDYTWEMTTNIWKEWKRFILTQHCQESGECQKLMMMMIMMVLTIDCILLFVFNVGWLSESDMWIWRWEEV